MDAPDLPLDASSRAERLADLKRRLPRSHSGWSGTSSRAASEAPLSLWHPGTIGEWLTAAPGSGAATVAWRTLAQSLPNAGLCAIVDSGRTCWASAIAGWGLGLSRFLVIRPKQPQEGWWAVEQSLRSRGVAVTCAWADRVPERMLRRWQLAAEVGGGIGLIFRPVAARREPSWAEFRVLVSPVPEALGDARRVRLEVVYRRGSLGGSAQVWEIDHAQGVVQLVPALADSTAASRAAGAETSAARAL